jgi:putative FmdB family regulatory protein
MPLYEYRCEACGQPEEKLESLSAPEAHACPACGAALGMKRQVSVAAFALAGGGWYKGAASEPKAPEAKAADAKAPEPVAATAEAPKSSSGCGAGGCGCH